MSCRPRAWVQIRRRRAAGSLRDSFWNSCASKGCRPESGSRARRVFRASRGPWETPVWTGSRRRCGQAALFRRRPQNWFSRRRARQRPGGSCCRIRRPCPFFRQHHSDRTGGTRTARVFRRPVRTAGRLPGCFRAFLKEYHGLQERSVPLVLPRPLSERCRHQ